MNRIWWVPSIVVVILVLGSPLLASLGLVGPSPAFRAFFAGVGIAAISAVGLGGAAAFASATGRAWRGAAVRAAAIPLLLVLGVLLPNLGGGSSHPIHDVTTDPTGDSVQFAPDVAARPEGMTREQVLAAQSELYPDIAPVALEVAPADAYARALAAANAMDGWEVVSADEATGRITATATSRIFRFVDDIIIVVAPEGSGSRINMRSRSRIGQSDLGANSTRVRAYLLSVTE